MMTKTTKFMMGGVAAAALLVASAAYAQGDQVEFGPETYDISVDEFHVDHFIGTVEVIVENRNTIQISATGDTEHMDRLDVDTSGETVTVSYEREDFRWNDWSTWVSWWGNNHVDIEDYPTVTVRVPENTHVDVNRMTGSFNAGDLNAPFNLDGVGALDAVVGNVTEANIDIAGAAEIELGDVAGHLAIEISGAGDVTAGNSESADIEIHGASEIFLGDVNGDLDISVAGVGDVRADSVNGDVDIALAGAGEIRIEDGRATSFDVSIAGAGDVRFNGVAVDPEISVAGAGNVYIQEYEGRLDHSGMGSVQVGS